MNACPRTESYYYGVQATEYAEGARTSQIQLCSYRVCC